MAAQSVKIIIGEIPLFKVNSMNLSYYIDIVAILLFLPDLLQTFSEFCFSLPTFKDWFVWCVIHTVVSFLTNLVLVLFIIG